ncbi:ABC transporter permease [Pseudobacteriovorax antillogorgiicola]|uniref:Microcin C transport system permease protein n=1 Tax=Pseudobacteriovorax antillogorgiicola TaxID=1513793 RepID=A0A1Y6BV79_9BACT|nr:ABC transporter permease subunit [Pseudobacteriovorax antillogorgiicola]TCS52301.1 microcin C transport system permease protein [Pseudobacteriovorax antillogorgiicola]SMF30409.1 microcin C transport system permease protein [Pseudobacteriovorax antillogorgiicola]
MIKISPITQKRLRKFRSIRRGYYSTILLVFLVGLSLIAELFINSRALMVRYQGEYYFPTYGAFIPGTTFGESYDWETNYRKLKERFAQDGSENFVILPIVPYNPYENNLKDGEYPPFPPNSEDQHYLGTDNTGRDILARLFYGFRTAILFSLGLLVMTYSIGISVGCMMGYFGGKFDIVLQRMIEIWSNIPFLYVVIIMSSIMVPNFTMLIVIMVMFSWPAMTWYMRTATYKEKAREYVHAAKASGASTSRIIFNHILPNTISTIITFVPFQVVSGITSLTALDYLGFGLPAPTPSWGELLQQGTENLSAIWIVSSVVTFMVVILIMVTFVGEAIREAFDPKVHTTYE